MAVITKEILVNATLADTWALVGDMEKFSLCIPGCKEVKKISDTEFDWVVDAKIMRTTRTVKAKTKILEMREPVHASFSGDGRLFERSNHYKMQIDGTTDLTELSPSQTRIDFSGEVKAKGAGGALIDKIVAGQMEPLFAEFEQKVKGALGDDSEPPVAETPAAAVAEKDQPAIWPWVAGAAAVAIAAWLLLA
ncbi:MAG: CoxG family protein [Pseudomonadales bacterium]